VNRVAISFNFESETVVAHLTKLNDIAALFTNNERSRYLYLLKIFSFSLKGYAKIWYNSLDPGCVQSPQDMIYYFSAGLIGPHKILLEIRFYIKTVSRRKKTQICTRLGDAS